MLVGGGVETPLLLSTYFSSRLGCKAYLKLENLQPSQSFKYRGISTLALATIKEHGPAAHLVTASTGNAALACARVAQDMGGIGCTVCVIDNTPQSLIDLLRSMGANVEVVGEVFGQAAIAATQIVAENPHAVYVHPYDDERLWEGHSKMVLEMAKSLKEPPKAIFCAVGGGGLLSGIMRGCDTVGWTEVPIITVETDKAANFYHTIMLNKGVSSDTKEVKDAQVEKGPKYGLQLLRQTPTSKAVSLGSSIPSEKAVHLALKRPLHCIRVPDELSMKTAHRFAEEHKMMVELACTTTLVPGYYKEILHKAIPGIKEEDAVVFVVCGGVKMSIEDLREYGELSLTPEMTRAYLDEEYIELK